MKGTITAIVLALFVGAMPSYGADCKAALDKEARHVRL